MNSNEIEDLVSIKTTIIITSYNQHISLLKESILSCLRLENTLFDLVVIDDCSINPKFDESEVIKFIQNNRSGSLRDYYIIRNDVNIGHPVSLNKAIEFSNTNYILYMSGDDLLPYNSLTKLEEALIDGPFDIVTGNLLILDDDGNMKNLSTYDGEAIGKSTGYELLNLFVCKQEHLFFVPGSLISKNLLSKVGLFEVGFNYFEDGTLLAKVFLYTNPRIKIVNISNYIWRNYSGITNMNDYSNLENRRRKLLLINDHILFYNIFVELVSNIFTDECISDFKNRIDDLLFTKSFVDLYEKSYVDKILFVVKNYRTILKKLSIKRIKRFVISLFGSTIL